MRFAAVLSLIAVASLASFPAVAGPGDDVTAFKSLSVTDTIAQSMWEDQIRENSIRSGGDNPPEVLVYEQRDRYGRRITFTQLQSGMTCGASACSSRLFVDGKLVTDMSACVDRENTSFAADGTAVNSCGGKFQVPPPGAK